ncbi:MAG: GGDEF domain-containing protein [Campylobacterota bacterium]|nr:GGDEF domain-containing protein [Campylobacterota bacterium]
MLILGYFIYQQIISKQLLKQDHKLLDDVLNFTEDMMFSTDFKDIGFSNKKFKEFLNIKNDKEFNQDNDKTILSIFSSIDGYLHENLAAKDETFVDLLSRTTKEDRVVSILDKSISPKSFAINIVKTNHKGDKNYLVTLTDITELKKKEINILNKAFYDTLTSVYNRNKFDEIVEQELKRDTRYKRNLSIAIIDIDKFKNFNDTYGHLIGDEVLIMLSKCINENVRDTDTFARWGGEEFVILFPETNAQEAKIVCEKLRIKIENLSHEVAGGVTASFGITQYKEDDTMKTIFKRCDDALYEAKENGRNMVCVK